jgi:hypothetical protein
MKSAEQKFLDWLACLTRYTPDIGVTRGEALKCGPLRKKALLDAVLPGLIARGMVIEVREKTCTRIKPTDSLLSQMSGGVAL